MITSSRESSYKKLVEPEDDRAWHHPAVYLIWQFVVCSGKEKICMSWLSCDLSAGEQHHRILRAASIVDPGPVKGAGRYQ